MIGAEHIAGDTLDFLDDVPDYPPADGWTLQYRLIPRFTAPVQAPVDISATTEGTQYRVQVSADQTAAWTAGFYTWSRWVEKAGPIRQSLGSGQFEVKADPSVAAAGLDTRTSARRILDAIEAVIEGRASRDQEEYTIAGANGSRQLKRTPIADLLVLRDRFKAAVESEEAIEQLAAGLGNPRTFGVRFNRV